MARPCVLGRVTPEVRRRLRLRRRWPRTLLARALRCSRRTVYNHFPGTGPVPTEDVLSAIDRAQERDQWE